MCPCLSTEVVVIKSQIGLASSSSLLFAYGSVGSFVLSLVVLAYDDISHY